MRRAETVKNESAFKRDVCRLRRAWNRVYPRYALGEPDWAPESAPSVHLFCLPPALGAERDAAIRAREQPTVESQIAFDRWRRLVLWLCERWWPPAYFPNWLNAKWTHPAILFVSMAMLWRVESIPAAAIVTGGPPAQPLLFDPDDEMSHPAAVYWHAFGRHVVDSVRDAIARDGDLDLDMLAEIVERAALVGTAERTRRLDDAEAHPVWYVRLFPGMTTVDRDEMMSSVMEAVALQYGDHPLRAPVLDLAGKGMSQQRIADTLGVDRGTVRRLLRSGRMVQS